MPDNNEVYVMKEFEYSALKLAREVVGLRDKVSDLTGELDLVAALRNFIRFVKDFDHLR